LNWSSNRHPLGIAATVSNTAASTATGTDGGRLNFNATANFDNKNAGTASWNHGNHLRCRAGGEAFPTGVHFDPLTTRLVWNEQAILPQYLTAMGLDRNNVPRPIRLRARVSPEQAT
jgi:hypothetical protein